MPQLRGGFGSSYKNLGPHGAAFPTEASTDEAVLPAADAEDEDAEAGTGL